MLASFSLSFSSPKITAAVAVRRGFNQIVLPATFVNGVDQGARFFSSSGRHRQPRRTQAKTAGANDLNPSANPVLYERDPSSNNVPRGCVWLSLGNSAYWTWYAVDFIPAINNSPLSTWVDPWIGVAGCTIAYAMTFVSWAYCQRLVSKIVRLNRFSMHVFFHSLPLLKPSTRNPLEYAVGDLQLLQDTRDVREFVEQLGGGTYKGHLALQDKNRKWPFGIYICYISNHNKDIPNRADFLEMLLFVNRHYEKQSSAHKSKRRRSRS